MASTYSPSLRLELMATGDQSGTWGDTTNTNLGMLLEQSITGYLSKAMADTNQTLTNLNGASDEARNMVLNLTGALTAGRNVVVPTAPKVYLVKNSTTGGFAVTVKTSAGTGVAVAAGASQWVYCDGTDVVQGLVGYYTVGGTDVAITDGGTGQSTPNLPDGTWRFANTADPTKLIAFDLSSITTGNTRTLSTPNASGTIALTSDLNTLTPSQAYKRSNILGPVSIFAGVPTGALIESGSNANGTFQREADGTLICTQRAIFSSVNINNASGAVFYATPAPSINYPSAFVGTPVCKITIFASGKAAWAVPNGLPTSTAWPSVYPFAEIAGTATTLEIHYEARGRWA